jgi:hypothetical protein
MANNIVIHYRYEEDLASTKQLLEANVDTEGGTIFEDHEKPFDERYGFRLRTMVVNFPTSWHAIWFIAKLTSYLDFIWHIDAMIDGTLRGD